MASKKEKIEKVPLASSSSLSQYYFSPRRTRSQVTVEYEKVKKLTVAEKIKKEEKITTTKRKLYTPDHLLPKQKQDELKNRKTKIETQSVDCCKPVNWEEVFENLKQMRSESVAPVDTMGCDKCPDDMLDEKTKRFQVLVALMLSSQTKDQTTYEAMNRLKENSLIPEKIVAMNLDELEKLLHPISFYKTKAKHLQKTCKILIDQYESDIPNTLKSLIKLPGVGPKMAHICMKSAWNIVTGIGVDVHVHRISNRLGWVKNTKDPEQTRIELESWLPTEHWGEVNHLLVGFGQTICTPVKPNCLDCKNQNLCPSAFKVESKNKKK